MDWVALLEMLWSPLWFCWDLIGTVGILMMVRKWIRGSVTDTSADVLKEITKPTMAEKVRVAWDIPNRQELKAAIDGIPFPPIPSLSPLEGQIAAISLKVDKFPKIDISAMEAKLTALAASIEAMKAEGMTVNVDEQELTKKVQKAVTSALGSRIREENKERDELIDQYKTSQYGMADQRIIYDNLLKMGVPPGAAEFAAVQGPTAARYIAEEFLGAKRAKALADAWEKGRMVQVVPR